MIAYKQVMEAKTREIFTALRMLDEDENRLSRRKQPPRFVFTTPPKANNGSESNENVEKTPNSKYKSRSGKRKANVAPPGDKTGDMPWDLDDLQTLGFEKEGTDTPTKKQHVSSLDRRPPVENEQAPRTFPRNQSIYPS